MNDREYQNGYRAGSAANPGELPPRHTSADYRAGWHDSQYDQGSPVSLTGRHVRKVPALVGYGARA